MTPSRQWFSPCASHPSQMCPARGFAGSFLIVRLLLLVGLVFTVAPVVAGMPLEAGQTFSSAGLMAPSAPGPSAEAARAPRDLPDYRWRRQYAGEVTLIVTNLGMVGRGDLPIAHPSLQWGEGEYLSGAGVWIGAIASDHLPHVSTGFAPTDPGAPAIHEFRSNPGPGNDIHTCWEESPGGDRAGMDENADDDADGRVDEEFQNALDDDDDGLIDEDLACASAQMLNCETVDYTPESQDDNPEHRPLGISLRQSSYSWIPRDDFTGRFVGFDLEFRNNGWELLREVYLGIYADPDVGPLGHSGIEADDRAEFLSIDTTFVDPSVEWTCLDQSGTLRDCAIRPARLELYSMADLPDDGVTTQGGDVDGQVGILLLGHTTDPVGEHAPARVRAYTARAVSGAGAYPQGEPRNDVERYDMLASGLRATRPTAAPDDYRFLISVGPFRELQPGESLRLSFAIVVGTGRDGLIASALEAARTYAGFWADADGDPRTGEPGEETCLTSHHGEPTYWPTPCDSLDSVVLEIQSPDCLPENYVDNDCDCCTPLFRNQAQADTAGLELNVHWVGPVDQPVPVRFSALCPPDLEVRRGPDRSVRVRWDNRSELGADPEAGRIRFSGYRLWRAVRGPQDSAPLSRDDWTLLSELRNSGEGNASGGPLLGDYCDTEALPETWVATGSSLPEEEFLPLYPVGRYEFVDPEAPPPGSRCWYAVTPYAVWTESGERLERCPDPVAREEGEILAEGVWVPGLAAVRAIPNPAGATTTELVFSGLPGEPVTIEVYAPSGRLVRSLRSDRSAMWSWDLRNTEGKTVPGGVYLYLVRHGSVSRTGRFVFLR